VLITPDDDRTGVRNFVKKKKGGWKKLEKNKTKTGGGRSQCRSDFKRKFERHISREVDVPWSQIKKDAF